MSMSEIGLRPEAALMNMMPQVACEQPSTDSLALATRYEGVSRLAHSIAAMSPEDLSSNLPALLRPFFPCDLANIVVFCSATSETSCKSFGDEQLSVFDVPLEETTVLSVYRSQQPLWVVDWQQDDRQAVQKEAPTAMKGGYRSLCRLPLRTPQGCIGVLSLASFHRHSFSEQEILWLLIAADQIALGMANFLLQAQVRKLQDEISADDVVLNDDSTPDGRFEGIVGQSSALQRVLQEVVVVAPTDSSVLILGETGTGKELIAQAIHNNSARRERPFIKVNCAAIPSGLLESELFGHEKGAFTGAIMRKPGRFELADKGTLFLDEVGDIPLDLQAKLLRVLQEREFERLGSTRTQQVDVRVIAATHRDLKQMVEEGTFRSDLYYRLHVFPMTVPPLRERSGDIAMLMRHFVDTYARRMNRTVETIPAKTMEACVNYSWPGNVRELQNFIERAVILSPGASLRAPLDELREEAPSETSISLSTLEEMEREHVLRALKESNWVTGGPKGAAVRLGMKRTTLAYRIRKLGIPVRPQ